MHTLIGQRLNSSPSRLAAASAFAVFVVAADIALAWWRHYPESTEGRNALALVALMASVWLVQGDLPSLGMRLTPAQGWRHWVWVALLIGLVVAACIVAGLGALVLSGHEPPVYATAPGDIGAAFLRMCVIAPLAEEIVYRLVLCLPLAVLLGPWRAVVVSGLTFGALHFASGNPSPENLVAGFFLAWAYLRSESIAIPMLLHGIGNLFALAAQAGAWHWLKAAV